MPQQAASSSLQNDDAGELRRQIIELLTQLESKKNLESKSKFKLKKTFSRLFNAPKNSPDPYETCRKLLLQLWSLYPENYQVNQRNEVLELEKRFNNISRIKDKKYRFKVIIQDVHRRINELCQEGLSAEEFSRKIRQIKIDIPYTTGLKRSEKKEILFAFLNLLNKNENQFNNRQLSEYVSLLNTVISTYTFDKLDEESKEYLLNSYATLFVNEFNKDFQRFSQEKNENIEEENQCIIRELNQSIEPNKLLSFVFQKQSISTFLKSFTEINSDALHKTLKHHMNHGAYGYNNTLAELIDFRSQLQPSASSGMSIAASSSDTGSSWRERKGDEQSKYIVHSYDFDGCTGQCFIPTNLYAKPDLLMIGSTRQSQLQNQGNKQTNNIKDDAFHMLIEWHKQYDIPYSPLLYADIDNELACGTAFNSSKDYDYSTLYDNTKISLLFTQMWATSLNQGDKTIDFHFFDDREEILLCLQAFYSQNPDLIPENVNLHLHLHAPLKESHYDIDMIQGKSSRYFILNQEITESKHPQYDTKSARIKAFLTSQDRIKGFVNFSDSSQLEKRYNKIISELSIIEKDQQFTDAYKEHLKMIMKSSPYPHYKKEIRKVREIFRREFQNLLKLDILSTDVQEKIIHFLNQVADIANSLKYTDSSNDFSCMLNQILELCHSDICVEIKNIPAEPEAASSYSHDNDNQPPGP